MSVAVPQRNLGSRNVPQDIKDLRKESWDYHVALGMPAIHKHRWNLRDVREGRAQLCPLNHDDRPGRQWDPYCFGTGILGGFNDGEITYVTLGDTPVDTIQATSEGVLIMERHPQMTAPWTPDMGDGDLLITADFDNELNVLYERERYILDEVQSTTIRGFQRQVQTVEFKVSQSAQVDLLPYGHELYNVPITFDYDAIPPDVWQPDEPIPEEEIIIGAGFTRYTQAIRVTGVIGNKTNYEQGLVVEGGGDVSVATYGIALAGHDTGAIVHIP